jgi:tRNA threonylcarbamoyladenosine biosynthesis protein TsaB
VAAINGDGHSAQLLYESNQTHTRHLMNMVAHTMKTVDLTVEQIDLLAVTRGPGSFTGLRIGISTVMGLRAATGTEAVGLSSLGVLARQAVGAAGWIVPMIDARRDEVYFSLFRATETGVERAAPDQVGAPDAVALPDEGPALFIGNGAAGYRPAIEARYGRQARFASPVSSTIHALTVAECALARFVKNAAKPVEDLAPIYLRKPDAEINRQAAPADLP